jgi:hypothetical protein
MGAVHYSETSVNLPETTWYSTPEDSTFHTTRWEKELNLIRHSTFDNNFILSYFL